jgi:hypothetical protein
MYQVVKEPVAWIDSEWDGLDEEGYEQVNTIRMKVVFLPLSEMETILKGETQEATVEFAKRVTRDWSQILGPDQKPFPFTAENLGMVTEHTPGFAVGFFRSYLKAWTGQGRTRSKNLESSPSDGRADAGQAGTSPTPQTS